MADQETSNPPERPANPPQPRLGSRLIQNVKDYFEKRRAEKQKENSQDRASQRTANATIWIAILTAVTIGVGISQYIIFGRQLNVMENDKRPWLSASVSLGKFIEITEWSGSRGVNVPLKITMKNYGQEPAVNIRVNSRAWPHPGNLRRAEILPLQKRACEEGIEAADKDPTGGIAIFPSETAVVDGVGNVSGRSLYADGAPMLWAIFGCVDYTYGGRKHGQTGFNFLLGKDVDGMVLGIPFIEGFPIGLPPSEEQVKAGFPKEQPKWAKIPVSEVLFMPADSGNYAK